MNILALTPSYACTGYCLLSNGALEYGRVPLDAVPGHAARRNGLFHWVASKVDGLDSIVVPAAWRPDDIAITTTLLDAAFLQEVPAYRVTTHEWKRALLGLHSATVDQMLAAAQAVAGSEVTDQQVARAVCIALAASRYPELLRPAEGE